MDPDPIDGDQVYAAERLLQTRTRRGQQEFLVKWKGWNSKHNTWEPKTNILDERLIQEFEQRVGTRGPKRRAVGAPPSSSGGKESSTVASSSVGFGPPQPKRGRRAVNLAKTDNVSEVSSLTTSVSTRRSSRRSSAAKGSRDGSVVEKAKREDKAISEPKPPSKTSPVKAQETEQVEDKEMEPSTETELEPTTEDEEKSEVDEKKATLSQDEMKQAATEPVVEQPLEIYVEHTVKTEKFECAIVQQDQTQPTNSTNSDAPIENGQPKSNEIIINEDVVGEDAFIITNESDPTATHKIQVYTLSDNGNSNEEQQKAAPSGSKSVLSAKSMDDEGGNDKDIIVVKSNDQKQSGSVVDTVGSSDEGKSHVTINGQNKESAETVVATVTIDEE